VALGVVWILDLPDSLHPHDAHGGCAALFSTDALMGGRVALGAWLYPISESIQTTLAFFFLLFGLKVPAAPRNGLRELRLVAIFALPRGLSSTTWQSRSRRRFWSTPLPC